MFDTVSLIVLAFATHQSLKACLHLMFLRAVQFSNAFHLPSTLLMSKLDKSSEVKELQPLNILCISVTADVLKLDRFSEVKPVQPLNI